MILKCVFLSFKFLQVNLNSLCQLLAMALPKPISIGSRNLSRRDHVLNLLPPLTVVSKEDSTMHDRLFAENPPPKTYPKNFPSKVLRHLGAWTFYSAPTKGELALLEKNMYDLENETEETDATEKQTEHISYNEYKTEHGTQSNYAGVGKKRLEATKEKNANANQIQVKKEEEKTSQKETKEKTKQKKSSLTSKSRDSNSLQKIKQKASDERNENVTATKKTIKRRSNLKRPSNKQQKNAQVNNKTKKPHTLVSDVEITLKKSRGKVLGGAETGTEIITEELTVEGHNMSVSGPERVHGKSCKNFKEMIQETEEVIKAGDNRESIKLDENERKDIKLRKASRSSNSGMYTPKPCDEHKGSDRTVASEKTQTKKVKRSVIKIPLQENESPEENDSKTTTSQTEDLDQPNKADSCEPEKCVNENNQEGCVENLCGDSKSEMLREKHVSFSGSCEKEQFKEKKRPKSQTGRKRERKRSGKNRVKSG